MKIICIGRNYADHAKELKNEVPTEPVFFLKPDSAILPTNKPFFYPEFSSEIHHEVEIVVRINRLGKHIDEKFAPNYYQEIAIGIDFTARDIQQQCKEKGLPWEKAKAFDHSAPISKFYPISKFTNNIQSLHFHLLKNDEKVQQGNTCNMLFSINQIIAYVSKFMTLKIGDLIFTGTPSGVGPVKIGDKLEAFIENEKLLTIPIR